MDNDILLDLNIIEILLISTMAFLGSFFHRFWQFIYNHHPITLNTWMAIFVNMLIISVITYSFNPLLSTIHQRLILLPPLLMGLVGEELINKLIHIESSLGFIDWFLKYFKLKNPDSETPNITADEEFINKQAKYQELLANIIELNNKLEDSINEYRQTKNDKIIIECYRDILMSISLVEARYRQFAYKDDILEHRHDDMISLYRDLNNYKKKIYEQEMMSD